MTTPPSDVATFGLRTRRQVLLVIAAVSIGSLILGLVVSRFLTSPADAAARAEPPEASAITVPVEQRRLESAVVTRGDAEFEGATDVRIETAGFEGPALVTGRLPEVGQTLNAGDVLLEIAGRPVILLEGDLPTYRGFEPGAVGPDVAQLNDALRGLGYEPGEGDEYDAASAAAVAALFEEVGYAPAALPEEIRLRRDAARDAVSSAEENVRLAEQSLAAAGEGLSRSERLSLDASVTGAERALSQAKQPDDDGEIDEEAVTVAEEQLEIARVQREERLAAPDTSAEKEALAAAKAMLEEARAELKSVEAAARTRLPASEVVFVPNLPRRVDRVPIERGEIVDGPVLSVSGSDLVVVAVLSRAEAELVAEGAAVQIELDDGVVDGTIIELRERLGEDGTVSGAEALIEPDELSTEQRSSMRGRNLRITIPVQSTDGEVLAVPLAALHADADGDARVEVDLGDGERRIVTVEVGLSASGFAEVRPLDGELEPGDLLVVDP